MDGMLDHESSCGFCGSVEDMTAIESRNTRLLDKVLHLIAPLNTAFIFELRRLECKVPSVPGTLIQSRMTHLS